MGYGPFCMPRAICNICLDNHTIKRVDYDDSGVFEVEDHWKYDGEFSVTPETPKVYQTGY